jgi:hypothetical protein
MCSNCGFPSTLAHWTEAGASNATDRLRSRFRRSASLRVALSSYGLSAHDDGATSGIALSDKTGRIEIVENLKDLWVAAERLCGRPVDPLDPRFTRIAES